MPDRKGNKTFVERWNEADFNEHQGMVAMIALSIYIIGALIIMIG